MAVMIRPLREDEFPLVEMWRAAHFEELNAGRPVTGQKGFKDAFWIAAERRGELVAVASVSDDDANRVRWVHDLYGESGHALGVLFLAEHIERWCDEQDYELRGATDPENRRFLGIIRIRKYQTTAVEYRRPRLSERLGDGATAPAEKAQGAVSVLGRRHAKV